MRIYFMAAVALNFLVDLLLLMGYSSSEGYKKKPQKEITDINEISEQHNPRIPVGQISTYRHRDIHCAFCLGIPIDIYTVLRNRMV